MGASWEPYHTSQVLHYGTGDGEHNYRTWYADVTTCFNNKGLLVSMKIDHIRGNQQDDHVILMLHFSDSGQLIQALALLQMKNEDTVKTGVLQGSPSQILSDLEAKLDDALRDASPGRTLLPGFVHRNAEAATSSIRV